MKVALGKDGSLALTTISGLDSTTEYNVLLEVVESNGAGQEEVRASDPVVVAAP